jgi:hypothetical protein
MRRHWHIVVVLLALLVGVVVFLWPGKSQEPRVTPPGAEDEVPQVPVSSPRLEDPIDTQPADIHREATELTQRAINARAVGDIATAIALFEQAISSESRYRITVAC